MESQTSIYSNRKYSYQILDSLSIELEITDNPFDLPLEELFVMAARRNKKRSFLFVSKILGKHLPISPSKGLLTGALLADQYASSTAGMNYGKELNLQLRFEDRNPDVPEAFIPSEISPVIIGFAETATALGQAFFASFKKADYFHTTREVIADRTPVITFEEEHSHATSHRCYVSKDLLNNSREIVLVDDEMSTGKTAINIIRSIHSEFPREVYSVVSILDWRSDENVQKFKDLEHELGVKIRCISLLKGNFSVSGHSPASEMAAVEQPNTLPELKVQKHFADQIIPAASSRIYGGKLDGIPYAAYSGRFGLDEKARSLLDDSLSGLAAELSRISKGHSVLCVGSGEFMYIPMKIAALMSDHVSYQSTTRSPIHIVDKEGYGARFGIAFPSPEDLEVQHYLYNVAPYQYDEVFMFFEREIPDEWLDPMLKEFQKTGIQTINLVFFHSRMVKK
jgi:hypothetical protein